MDLRFYAGQFLGALMVLALVASSAWWVSLWRKTHRLGDWERVLEASHSRNRAVGESLAAREKAVTRREREAALSMAVTEARLAEEKKNGQVRCQVILHANGRAFTHDISFN